MNINETVSVLVRIERAKNEQKWPINGSVSVEILTEHSKIDRREMTFENVNVVFCRKRRIRKFFRFLANNSRNDYGFGYSRTKDNRQKDNEERNTPAGISLQSIFF